MFNLSTKGDYGLIIMYDLALNDRSSYVSLRDIAERYSLSTKYLSRIMLPLKKHRLIESKEGMDGGYQLAREPEKIQMLEIIEALEGSIAPVKCLAGQECAIGPCALQNAWNHIHQELVDILEHKTLADFISLQHIKTPHHAHIGN